MNRFKQKKISSLKRKSPVCNGLTAEGLASPLVRVTRLRQKWVHHQSVWRGGGREKTPPKQSPPTFAHPLPRSVSVRRVGLRPAPSAPLPSKRRGGRQGTGGLSAAMKDRMQELRHVSWCLIVAATCSGGGVFTLSETPEKQRSVLLLEQQLWFLIDAHILCATRSACASIGTKSWRWLTTAHL